jgi:hypothetical protein
LKKAQEVTKQQLKESKAISKEEIEAERVVKNRRYVIPYGLEEIVKPLVGYIINKTNRIIDAKEKGLTVSFK